MKQHKTLRNLPNNLRFYVLAFTVLLSLCVAAWLRQHIQSDELFQIRTQQIFGFLSLVFWYVALITSPMSKLFGKQGFMGYLLFSRRAIGVSAAYFALLHAVVSFWGQLGGFAKFGILPDPFQWSLVFGLVGLLVLGVMAATSFDKVVKYMTFRRWKLLHRVGYVAGVLVLLHIWMISTHIGYYWLQLTFAIMLVALTWLESYRVSLALGKKYKRVKAHEELTVVLIWAVCLGLLFGIPRVVENYHQQNHSNTQLQEQGND